MPVIKDITLYLPTHPTQVYAKRNLSEIDTIVVHQTDSKDSGKFGVYDIARYHVNNNGWAGIGYHYYIIKDGKIFKTQEPSTISYHASNWNTRSIGVVITGDHRYNSSKTNEEIIGNTQYKALVWTLAKLQTQLPNKANILSHGELSTSKSDPNLNMEQLKLDVKKKRQPYIYKRAS
tara:strand:+ start:235 stop:765 length:531 start_codon:yes stop_codon:yes gene_type:complete